MESPPRVSYIWSQDLQRASDCLPANPGRSSMVHGLIEALGLLDNNRPTHVSTELDQEKLTIDGARQLDKAAMKELGRHDNGERRAIIVPPDMSFGTEENLRRYHDREYVSFLLRHRQVEGCDSEERDEDDSDSDSSSTSSRGSHRRKRRKTEIHGFEHDCPPFPNLAEYARQVSAGTLTACRLLTTGQSDIAIHWDGGRHHTMRNRASGFCYVADVVLGIMLLAKEGKMYSSPLINFENDKGHSGPDEELILSNGTEKAVDILDNEGSDVSTSKKGSNKHQHQAKPRRPRIMYLDLDLHYGDGVAQAFQNPAHYPSHPPSSSSMPTPKKPPRPPQTLTFSIHHTSSIFFPPHTPLINLPSPTTPHPFTLSLPLSAYPSSTTYEKIWENSVEPIRKAFDPDYVVLQLGVDGLPNDPIGRYGAWGVHGVGGIRWCLEKVKGWGRPLCVLGGGGYRSENAARAWAVATSVLLDRPLIPETPIPDHPFFPAYAPSFDLEVAESTVPDENREEDLDKAGAVFKVIAERIQEIIRAHA